MIVMRQGKADQAVSSSNSATHVTGFSLICIRILTQQHAWPQINVVIIFFIPGALTLR
jgi:hypothetical protein